MTYHHHHRHYEPIPERRAHDAIVAAWLLGELEIEEAEPLDLHEVRELLPREDRP